MANITLDNLCHTYLPFPKNDEDYALRTLNVKWRDNGSYALLGPSGCGKTTLLNIISGLLSPSSGRILFDGEDVTTKTPAQRNIAQVFQFPVIYDTMSVYDNLAFPLRNRKMTADKIDTEVNAIATMLELHPILHQKAQELSPDIRQKISMGRGLVRDDVNVMMFDEPLTVIDPLLKWTLRSKLKELQQKVNTTMIYVTHDQTEALTFADQVIVMKDGKIIQLGTPVELFEKPNHVFVGHFIGSPGMNVVPCELTGQGFQIAGVNDVLVMPDLQSSLQAFLKSDHQLSIGIRPEFLSIHSTKVAHAIPARVYNIIDVGRNLQVDVQLGDHRLRALVDHNVSIEEGNAYLQFHSQFTNIYQNDWRIEA